MRKSRPRVSSIAPVPADKSERKHKGYLFVKGIPETTKQAFKVACAASNPPATQRDVVLVLMRRFAMAVEAGNSTISIRNMRWTDPKEGDENKT